MGDLEDYLKKARDAILEETQNPDYVPDPDELFVYAINIYAYEHELTFDEARRVLMEEWKWRYDRDVEW